MNTADFFTSQLYLKRYSIAYALLAIGLLTAIFVQIGTLVPGLSPIEANSVLASKDAASLLENPVNALYRLMQLLSISLFGGSGLGARLPSAVFGATTLLLMFYTLRTWHTDKIAIIGTLLLGTSSWFVHIARLGTPAIMLPFAIVFILALLTWFNHVKTRSLSSLIVAAVGLLSSLYVPIVLVLFVILISLYFTEVKTFLSQLNFSERSAVAGLTLLAILPLVVSMFSNANVIPQIMGLENWDQLPSSILSFLTNIISTFGFIFWSSQADPEIHLGTFAMLDIFTATMTALGLFQYERHSELRRTKLLIGGFFAALIVASLSNNQAMFAILIPFVYVFSATGIFTLLTQWKEIFPKNPVARSLAIVPMAVLLIVVAGYHYNRYFRAWAQTATTTEKFNEATSVLRRDVVKNASGKNIQVLADQAHHNQIRASLIGTDTQSITVTDSTDAISKQVDVAYFENDSQIPNDLPIIRNVISSNEVNFIEFIVVEP